MKRNICIRSAVMAVLLAGFGASGAAFGVDEVEPNNPITSAQVLTIDSTGGAQVNGVIGTLTDNNSSDVDFFSFQGKAGDLVTIYTSGTTNLDTVIALFGPGTDGPFTAWAQNDTAPSLPPGSTNINDSLIANFQLPTDGTYVVGVSGYPLYFASTGVVISGGAMDTTSFGAYSLTISGVTPPPPPPPVTQPPVAQPPVVTPPPPPPPAVTQQINIDVLPGFRGLTRFDPKVKRSIPVVLLSSANFDPTQVDQSSLTFGVSGDEKSFERCNPSGVDMNHDGRRDLLCHFDARTAGFQPGDLDGVIKGKTLSGQEFEGKGLLKVMVEKRRHRDERHRDGDRDDRR